MRYRKLDSSGDYTFGTGADFYSDSPEAVAQAIATRLKLWRGEWFLDRSEGTPYLEEVLGERRTRSPDVAVKQRILGTPGVTEIRSFSAVFDESTRALTIHATVETEFGTASISETL